MAEVLAAAYTLALAVLSIYGILGLVTLALYWRHKGDSYPAPHVANGDLPIVTVQLPIYNERYVVQRLIDAAVGLEYPRERLEIQVIDDSDDDTAVIAASCIATYQAQGFDIKHLRRDNRLGYKAGALAAALVHARGEYLAIFDADFQPASDFLLRTIPHLVSEPGLGMIQARWGHLNAEESALTAAQSIALDKHFVMEQTVRHRAGLFPKFNGAGGIWRTSCVADAGGWQFDTVCEDLCLSTRAILKGWQFRFLADVVAPAELPTSIGAYKNQQARWAKGSTQCLVKYSAAIATDRKQSRIGRAYALLTMSAYATQWLLLLLLLLQVPMILFNVQLSAFLVAFTILGLGQPLLFILAQQATYSDWIRRLRHFPTLLLVAIGTAPNGSRAVLQALFGGDHPFVRTPKGLRGAGIGSHYRMAFDRMLLLEILLALYAAVGLYLAYERGTAGPVVLLLSCFLGLSYVAWLELRELAGRS